MGTGDGADEKFPVVLGPPPFIIGLFLSTSFPRVSYPQSIG